MFTKALSRLNKFVGDKFGFKKAKQDVVETAPPQKEFDEERPTRGSGGGHGVRRSKVARTRSRLMWSRSIADGALYKEGMLGRGHHKVNPNYRHNALLS